MNTSDRFRCLDARKRWQQVAIPLLVDRDVSGNGDNDDTDNFDAPGTAVAFVCAHGLCADVSTRTCNRSADSRSGQECTGGPPSSRARICVNNGAGHLLALKATRRSTAVTSLTRFPIS